MAPKKKKKTAKRSGTSRRRKVPAKRKRAKAPARPRAKKRSAARASRKTTRYSKRLRTSRQRPRARWLEDGRGLGLEGAGQSGDTEGLSRKPVTDSESVEELAEEGQAFEAGIVDGVENAPDADEGEIRTREVPEDDVPEEYLDKD